MQNNQSFQPVLLETQPKSTLSQRVDVLAVYEEVRSITFGVLTSHHQKILSLIPELEEAVKSPALSTEEQKAFIHRLDKLKKSTNALGISIKNQIDYFIETSHKKSDTIAVSTCLHDVRGTILNGDDITSAISKLIETVKSTKLSESLALHLDQIKKSVGVIESCAQTQTDLVNKALDESKAQLKGTSVSPIKINPANRKNFNPLDIIKTLMAMYEINKNNALITFQLLSSSDADAMVFGDPISLNRILQNLLVNAIEYSKGKPIAIYLEYKEKTASKILLEFRIADQGEGMSEEGVKKLFGLFVQVSDEALEKKPGQKKTGSGLGLYASKSLVEQMGGKIWVESEKNKGSVFAFTIECSPPVIAINQDISITLPKSKEVAPMVKALPKLKAGSRALIVEDIKGNQRLATAHLKSLGYKKIYIAKNGKDALGMCEISSYQVILMDINIGEPDGFKLTQFIRERERENKTKTPAIIVCISGYNELEDKAIKAGMNGFVGKPFKLEKFKEYIPVIPATLKKTTSKAKTPSGLEKQDQKSITLTTQLKIISISQPSLSQFESPTRNTPTRTSSADTFSPTTQETITHITQPLQKIDTNPIDSRFDISETTDNKELSSSTLVSKFGILGGNSKKRRNNVFRSSSDELSKKKPKPGLPKSNTDSALSNLYPNISTEKHHLPMTITEEKPRRNKIIRSSSESFMPSPGLFGSTSTEQEVEKKPSRLKKSKTDPELVKNNQSFFSTLREKKAIVHNSPPSTTIKP